MRSRIAARIGKLEEQHRPAAILRSKEQRDACVRAALADPAQIAALTDSLRTGTGKMAHVIAAAMRADA